jgi:hypothetical protein
MLYMWLVLLQKYITMHGPTNVKFYVSVCAHVMIENRRTDCHQIWYVITTNSSQAFVILVKIGQKYRELYLKFLTH